MEITEQTDTVLKLECRYLWVATMVMVLFSLPWLAPAIAGINLVRWTSLTCDRTASQPSTVDCKIQTVEMSDTAFAYPLQEPAYPKLFDLQQAKLQINEGRNGNTYRPLLITREIETPFTEKYHLRRNVVEKDIEDINQFLNDQGRSNFVMRHYEISRAKWAWTILGIMVTPGVIFFSGIFWERTLVCTFDRKNNICNLKRGNQFWSRKTEFPLEMISKAEFSGITVKLILKSGKRITLRDRKSPRALTKLINQFLN
ncbi:MAG: hypothetical protein ACFBSG_13220 [Leptolyngbyaceae cyanobacterium]